MQLLRGLVLVLGMCGAGLAAQAQTFPSKTVRIVVPFGAGGVADLIARTVGQKLSKSLGRPVVIDNKPGAGDVAARKSSAGAR